MKLVVPGGNGFIGSEICRVAVQNGHEVAAFGRTGRPALTPARHPWTGEVEWRAADVFAPDAWRDLLDEAEEATDADVDAFVYLSVRDTPPFVSHDFLAAKRRAERDVPEQYPDLRTVSLRPNLVYGPRRRGSATFAGLLNTLPGGLTGSYAEPAGRPLPVELVAAAAVHAATTPTVEGTLSVPQIDDLGRTSGLVDLDDLSEPTLTPLLAGLGGTALGAWLLHRWWHS